MEKMGKRFDGKVALITASTQGIGFGIAERLGLEGAAVVISSRRQKNVDEGVEKLKGIGIEVLGLVCHVSNAQQRKDLIKKTIEKFGKIDVIVCNAAANPAVDGILQTKESVLDKLWEINVKTSILLLQEAAPHLDKGSSVVFVSSIAAFQPSQGLAMYGVTKTALLGLTKEKKAFCKECAKNGNMALFHPSVNDAVTAMISSRLGQLALAAEMGPDIRVNCVAPGFVPTHFASFLTSNEEKRKSLEEKTILNRLGTTHDIAAAVAYLASNDASYVTGETLVVAGGLPSRL